MNYKKYILVPFIFLLNNMMVQGQDSTCTEQALSQNIIFAKKQVRLSSKNKATLDSILVFLNRCPKHILVMTTSSIACHRNPLIWDRLNSVALYIIEKSNDSARITTNYDSGNSCDIISFKLMLIDLSQDEPPHPNLRKNEANKPKNQWP